MDFDIGDWVVGLVFFDVEERFVWGSFGVGQ